MDESRRSQVIRRRGRTADGLLMRFFGPQWVKVCHPASPAIKTLPAQTSVQAYFGL